MAAGFRATADVQKYSSTKLIKCVGTEVQRYRGTEVHKYVHKYVGTEVMRCRGVEVPELEGIPDQDHVSHRPQPRQLAVQLAQAARWRFVGCSVECVVCSL